MYPVERNGRTILEADACGIGFLASRKGVAERRVVELGLSLAQQFDHRGAPGHGAGVQLDIPWPILLDRFGEHAKKIAQRDVALGMFFLPYEAVLRAECVETVEKLSDLAGARVLQWADVPVNANALEPGSSALRTLPVVRQAIFERPDGLSEDGWFALRYLLRLAMEHALGPRTRDEFSVASLSNRTVVYKGLGELSRIAELYTDLASSDCASRYVLFHSRYCTNTTTAWRRAQPFWSIAHNGEISTIAGNVAWMNAIGRDLLASLVEKHPSLERIAKEVPSVVCPGGSDTANLDDMVIALLAGGLSFPQAILALLPESESAVPEGSPIRPFYRAMRAAIGACDGPAALVACDGDHAVAHLDRNGLRPLWVATSREYVMAASELTGLIDIGPQQTQHLMGPGETFSVNLQTGEVLVDEEVRREVSRRPVPSPTLRTGESHPTKPHSRHDLESVQVAFGMTKEDLSVLVQPMASTGKPPVGSMGDDTPPAAMLDHLPRRLEDHFALRFAQETSPPVDPVRDAWVFDLSVMLGDRGCLFGKQSKPLFEFPRRILSTGELDWIRVQERVESLDATFPYEDGPMGLERELEALVSACLEAASDNAVLILSDRAVRRDRAALPLLRLVSRVHDALNKAGRRHRVGLVADAGVWDVHHVALLIAMGADAVHPWLGSASVGELEPRYLDALTAGFLETMSMMGVTPSSAYCGARLVEAMGLDHEFLQSDFPGVAGHLSGIGSETLNDEWLAFHRAAFEDEAPSLVDAGEFRHSREGRPHSVNAEIVRSLQAASGYARKIHQGGAPGTREAYRTYADLVSNRCPITVLDCVRVRKAEPIPLDQVEPVEEIVWRFMAPGMSEGALSEPAHRAVARAMNVLRRAVHIACVQKQKPLPPGIGPIANSGEGGFDKRRIGTRDGNASIQYAGGRFTITPMTAATALEAEVKFAQGAKPGKGGQLPGKKVSQKVALQRGCEPGYELVSPPINHNLYSIEDVKLMLESWRHLNPDVGCALKYVATRGVELVAVGGVNAGATRLHLSDGCGGTGAAKRVDQKHAGVPVAAVLPAVQDLLVEEGIRHLVEMSVDGGVQNGEQALKLFLLGADRVGFGTSLLVAIGCSMLRKCHLSGPDPADPTGKRRLGCTPGVATQDPELVARFAGKSRHIAKMLRYLAEEIRERMAEAGIRRLADVVGRRDLLERRNDLSGKAAKLDVSTLVHAPHAHVTSRDYAAQRTRHMPVLREHEAAAAYDLICANDQRIVEELTNGDRCVGVRAAGIVARARGDRGLPEQRLEFVHFGAAGHYYAAYAVDGLDFRLTGLAADSCFTEAYGGRLVIVPDRDEPGLTVVGNTFAYGARGGTAYIAGRGGNRFGICLRKSHEGTGASIVVEGVGCNAFQYMTGGRALVLGPTGFNLGSGMTGGTVYLLDADRAMLNVDYVHALPLDAEDVADVQRLLMAHHGATESATAARLLEEFDSNRFVKVVTRLTPESLETSAVAASQHPHRKAAVT